MASGSLTHLIDEALSDDFDGVPWDEARAMLRRSLRNGQAVTPLEARLAPCRKSGHIGLMRKVSLAHAKAHFSEIVDAAEHHGQRIVILRHGKPAAAVVPARLAEPRSRAMPLEEAKGLLDRLATPDPQETVDEALGRNRLDRIS